MNVDPELANHIESLFGSLDAPPATNAMPPPGSLSAALGGKLPKKPQKTETRSAGKDIQKRFATAAVEMWHRAVHSLLISALVSEQSPMWAAVAGYYSSHYAVRAIAHALGYFQLFEMRRNVRLQYEVGRCTCTFTERKGEDREHLYYWRVVKGSAQFRSDPFFTDNKNGGDADYRNFANYADHLDNFKTIEATRINKVSDELARIAEVPLTSPSVPKKQKYPDTMSVHIMAYYRVVRFRDLIDGALGGQNSFWERSRDPPWARGFTAFQLNEAEPQISRLASP